MNVVWSKKAYDDLDGIVGYISGLSSAAAENTINRIQEAVLMPADFPNTGTNVDETGLRRLVFPTLPM